MRIVHIITRLIIGGAQENTILTCRGLVQNGHEVTILTGPETGTEGDMFRTAQDHGICVRLIRNLRRDISPLHDTAALPELVLALRRLAPDVVHTHSSKAGILGRLAAQLAGVTVVVHTIHGLPFFDYQSRLTNQAYILAERLAAKWTDKLVTVADDMITQAIAARIAPAKKFLTVYSGLEVDAYLPKPNLRQQIRQRFGIPTEAFVVGKLARLAPLKGHEFLLEALKQLMCRYDNLWCLLVGDGTLRPTIEEQLRRDNLAERAHLTGLLDPAQIPEMLWAMDMLVHTSLHEGLPRAVVQGLLAGLPVAAFDLDGASEVIDSNKTGYLLKPGSVNELVQAIESVLTGTGPVKAPSTQVRAKLADRFRWERMVQSLEKLYYSML